MNLLWLNLLQTHTQIALRNNDQAPLLKIIKEVNEIDDEIDRDYAYDDMIEAAMQIGRSDFLFDTIKLANR